LRWLKAQPAHQRRVADHDRHPLQAVAQIARRRESLGDRQPRAGMAAVEDIVRRLAAAWEATDSADLAKRPEAVATAGKELVRIGLVAGVPDDLVARRFEQPMEGDRELHHTER